MKIILKEKSLTSGEREETETKFVEEQKDDAPLCIIVLLVNLG